MLRKILYLKKLETKKKNENIEDSMTTLSIKKENRIYLSRKLSNYLQIIGKLINGGGGFTSSA